MGVKLKCPANEHLFVSGRWRQFHSFAETRRGGSAKSAFLRRILNDLLGHNDRFVIESVCVIQPDTELFRFQKEYYLAKHRKCSQPLYVDIVFAWKLK